MAKHNPEDSGGAQLAMLTALKLILSAYRGNQPAVDALESELERMRAMLLGTAAEERKIEAFNATAEALIEAIKPKT